MNTKLLLFLSENQKKLDDYIAKTKNIDQINIEVFKKKLIAFIVEVSEFINEERSFKYWSNKPSSEKDVMLEEYIDGIHFIISIGNNLEYDFRSFGLKELKSSIIDNYLAIFRSYASLIENQNKQNYELLLNSYLNLSKILNFSTEDIKSMYIKKNEINFKRQDNNY